MAEYRMVTVHRNGKTYRRRQPLHHRVSKRVLNRELDRLEEQKEVVEENIKRAKERAEWLSDY